MSVKTVKCLQSQVAAFCEKYNLHKRFNFMQPNSISEDESDCSKMDEEDDEENHLNLSFSATLTHLCNSKYHLK